MNRYFKTNSETYEEIRKSMDSSSGYPNSEADSWFCSADEALKDIDGNCLIAAIPEIASKFIEAGAIEISSDDYISILNDL